MPTQPRRAGGPRSPNGTNYNSGQLIQEDSYQGNAEAPGALLRETVNSLTGMGGSYPNNSCDGNALEVYAPCVPVVLETKTTFFEGGTAANAPWIDTKYTYDDIHADGGYADGGYAYSGLVKPILNLAKPVLLKYAGQGFSALGSGLASLFSVGPSDDQDLDIMTNSQILDDCNAHHIVGC